MDGNAPAGGNWLSLFVRAIPLVRILREERLDGTARPGRCRRLFSADAYLAAAGPLFPLAIPIQHPSVACTGRRSRIDLWLAEGRDEGGKNAGGGGQCPDESGMYRVV